MHFLNKPTATIFTILLVTTAASTARAGDDYKIKLDHPFKAGDSFGVAVTVKTKYTQTFQPPPADGNPAVDSTCVMEGTETVTGVTAKGRQPDKYSVKITKCEKDGKPIIAAGATVLVENEHGRSRIRVDGHEPADELKPLLADLFETRDPQDPPADEEMGTPDRQKVGGTWTFKTDPLAKKLEEQKSCFTASDLKGTGTLTEVSKVDGKEIEKVTVSVEGGFDKRDSTEIAGGVYHNAKMKVEVVGMIPVDESARPISTHSTVTVSYTLSTPNQSVDVKIEQSRDLTITDAR